MLKRPQALLVTLLLLLGAVPALAKPPRLTLLIAVDSLSSDLLLRSRPLFTRGLKQLLERGAFYPVARYPYATSVTAVGHATLSTGARPWRHGIINNQILDRATGRLEPAFADSRYPALLAPGTGNDVSPESLVGETLADHLRMTTRGRGKAIAISGKAVASVAFAGRLGQAWWLSQAARGFDTSRYYAKQLPAWVVDFNREHAGALGVEPGVSLDASPRSQELLVAFARAAIDAEQLGSDAVPDLLLVSMSQLDFVFHEHGPYSKQTEQAMVVLDRTMGELLAAAERAAGGRANLLVAFSADHGGAAVPEHWTEAGLPAGRTELPVLEKGLGKQLEARFGAPLVAAMEPTDVYLKEDAIQARKLDGAEVRRAAARWLAAQPGIALAVTRDDLDAAGERGGYIERLRLGYYPGRSGDVLFVPRPFFILARRGTKHDSPYAYDSEVPIVFAGSGVRPGVYHLPISPIDVAPTLAAILEMGNPALVEGVPRAEALRP